MIYAGRKANLGHRLVSAAKPPRFQRMDTDVLIVERKEIKSGVVEVWRLNRPQALNTLNTAVLKKIEVEAVRLAGELQKNLMSCRSLLLIGEGGKAFVAGADIAEMKDFKAPEAEEFSRLGQRAFARLESLPIPTIAAVQGFALGGGLELAMCCDLIASMPNGEFGQPEAHLGLIPGFGATARFAQRMGLSKALELLYSGRRIKVDEALSCGLVQRLFTSDAPLLDQALALAEELTLKSSPLALAKIKAVTRAHYAKIFEETCTLEAQSFGEIFESADKREGVTAFLEKRRPKFNGI